MGANPLSRWKQDAIPLQRWGTYREGTPEAVDQLHEYAAEMNRRDPLRRHWKVVDANGRKQVTTDG